MKNRLQFNRHFPIFSGTTEIDGREQANEWLDRKIKSADFIPLIGEPIVLRYLDKEGNKQLILAVGKATGNTAGDTTRREYHVIDTAFLDEKIADEVITRAEADQDLQEQIDELVDREVLGQDAIKVVTVDGESTVSLLIKSDDKVLTQDDNGLKANISINYVSEDKRIYLRGADDVLIGEVDTTDFVKDGMLDSVVVFVATEEDHREHPELVVGETYLKLVFNTESGKQDVFVSVKELVDIYTVSATSLNYLTIEDYQIRANVDVENGLASKNSVDYISGVTDTIIKAAGLNQGNEGEYPTHDETHYIKNATSLDSADVILDDALYTLSGVVSDMGDISELEEKLNELSAATQDAVRNINNDIDDLQDDVRDLSTGLTQLTSTVNDNTNKINSLSAGTVSGLNELSNGLNTTNTNLNNLSGAVVSNESKINALSASVVTNKEDIAELSAATKSEVERLFGDITGVSDDLDVLSAATADGFERVNNDLVELDARVDTVSGLTDGVLTINVNGEPQGVYSPSADTTLNLTAITEVTGADVLLTGYEIATAHTAVAETDNVNEAMGKIEYRLVEIENNTGSPVAQIAILSGVVTEFSATTDTEIHRLDGRIDELSGVTRDVIDNLANLSAVTPTDVIYDTNNTTVYLVDNNGQKLGNGFNANEFIKDGMLDNVEIIDLTGETYLRFTFNTDAGSKVIDIKVSDFAALYSAGNGINISNTDEISVKVANKSEEYLKLDSDGLYISGITEIVGRVNTISASTYNADAKISALSAGTIQLSGDIVTYIDQLSGNVYNTMIERDNNVYSSAITYVDAQDNKVYASAVSYTDAKIAAIPPIPDIEVETAGTGNVVSQISADGHKITYTTTNVATSTDVENLSGAVLTLCATTNNNFNSAFTAINTLSGDVEAKINQLSAGTLQLSADTDAAISVVDDKIGALSSATVSHVENTDIHVTATDKQRWDAKQDAINNLQDIIDNAASGALAYTMVGELSGSVIDNKTAIAGKQDTINDLETIRNNAASGASAYTMVDNLSGAVVTLSASVVTGVSVNGGNVIPPVNGVVSFNISGQTLDGFFNGVEYSASTKELRFFNDDRPLAAIDVTEFAGVYSAGNGINISDADAISVKLADKSEEYLKLDSDGLYISGITAIVGGLDAVTDNISALSASVVNNVSNINALSGATDTHVKDTDIHVTTNDKQRWDAKQDAISNLQTIIDNAASGALAYTMVGELSAGTIQLSADTKNSIDSAYASGNSYTDAAIAALGDVLTGVSMNNTIVSVTDNVADLGTVITVETQLTSAVTGNGNVFSTIQVSDHEITMGKDFTAATSADVATLSAAVVDNEFVIAQAINNLSGRIDVISGWPASSITETMINNWNDKQGNVKSDWNAAAGTDAEILNKPDVAGLSSATIAHIESAASHVSVADRTFWTNGSNSGASAYTMVSDLSATVIEKSYVVAEALNDLNTRLIDAGIVDKTIGYVTVTNNAITINYDVNVITGISGTQTITVNYNSNLIPADGHVKELYLSVQGSGTVTFTATGVTIVDAGGETVSVNGAKVVKLLVGTIGSTTYFYFVA